MMRPIHLWLVGLNVALLSVIALSWAGSGAHWSPPPPLRPELSTLALPGRFAADKALVATHQRPLFATDRRASAEASAAHGEPLQAGEPAAPDDIVERLTLQGVVGAGRHGAVLLTFDGRPLRLPVGQSVEQWRLVRIRGLDVYFEHADGETLQLRIQRPRAKPAEPARQAAHSQPPEATQAAAGTPPQASPAPISSPAEFSQNLAERVAARQAQRAAAEEAFRQWQRANEAAASPSAGATEPKQAQQ